MKYHLIGTVERVVTDLIHLDVEAKTEAGALDTARRVLSVFPEGHDEDGIDYCYLSKRNYDRVESIEIQIEGKEID